MNRIPVYTYQIKYLTILIGEHKVCRLIEYMKHNNIKIVREDSICLSTILNKAILTRNLEWISFLIENNPSIIIPEYNRLAIKMNDDNNSGYPEHKYINELLELGEIPDNYKKYGIFQDILQDNIPIHPDIVNIICMYGYEVKNFFIHQWLDVLYEGTWFECQVMKILNTCIDVQIKANGGCMITLHKEFDSYRCAHINTNTKPFLPNIEKDLKLSDECLVYDICDKLYRSRIVGIKTVENIKLYKINYIGWNPEITYNDTWLYSNSYRIIKI